MPLIYNIFFIYFSLSVFYKTISVTVFKKKKRYILFLGYCDHNNLIWLSYFIFISLYSIIFIPNHHVGYKSQCWYDLIALAMTFIVTVYSLNRILNFELRLFNFFNLKKKVTLNDKIITSRECMYILKKSTNHLGVKWATTQSTNNNDIFYWCHYLCYRTFSGNHNTNQSCEQHHSMCYTDKLLFDVVYVPLALANMLD